MSTTIHVRGVSIDADIPTLKGLFEKYGTVDSISVNIEDTSPVSQSVFVVMPHADDTQRALTQLNGKDFGGRKLSMRQAALRRRG